MIEALLGIVIELLLGLLVDLWRSGRRKRERDADAPTSGTRPSRLARGGKPHDPYIPDVLTGYKTR